MATIFTPSNSSATREIRVAVPVTITTRFERHFAPQSLTDTYAGIATALHMGTTFHARKEVTLHAENFQEQELIELARLLTRMARDRVEGQIQVKLGGPTLKP